MVNGDDSDLDEFEGLQFLVSQGVEGARERRNALLDRRAAEWSDVQSRLADAAVWPTRVCVPCPAAVREAYERAPVYLVDSLSGQVTGVRPPSR